MGGVGIFFGLIGQVFQVHIPSTQSTVGNVHLIIRQVHCHAAHPAVLHLGVEPKRLIVGVEAISGAGEPGFVHFDALVEQWLQRDAGCEIFGS